MKIEQRKAKLTASVNFEVVKPEEESKIIQASDLEALRTLFPEIKKGNDDLLKVSFNVATANLVNANGHGILGPDAEACMENFVHKPFNIEHQNSWVIGHATNYGFSTFGDSKIIPKLTPKYTKSLEPFNMSLGGVVYKRADPYYAEMLKDGCDWDDHQVSASWEILYDEYVIALGSKRLSDAEIVTEDDRVKELTKYLSDEGGSGFTNEGVPVYRIIVGNVLPAGVGFTFSPAGDVKGIEVEDVADQGTRKKVTSSEASKEQTEKEKAEIKAEIKKEILNEISQTKKKAVTKKYMKIKDIADITEDALKESTASEIRDFIKDQLSAKSAEFKALEDQRLSEIEAKEKEASEKQAELEEKVKRVSELESEVATMKSSLEEITAAKDAMEEQNAFNERMETLDEKFEIGDAQREVVAKQIKGLSDEDFQAWLGDFGKLVSAKEEVKEDKPDTKKALSTASTKEDVPNAQHDGEVDDMEKYKKSFAKVTISV